MEPESSSGPRVFSRTFYKGTSPEATKEKGNKDQPTKEKKGLDTVNNLESFDYALNNIEQTKAIIGESGGRKFTYEGVEYSMNDIVKCYLRLVENSNLTDSGQRDLTIQVMKKLRQVNEGNQLKTDNLSIGKRILLSVKQLGGKEIDKLESKLKSAIKKGVNSHSSWEPNRREELINDMTTRVSVVNQQKVNMSMDQKAIKELEKMRESKSFHNLKMPEIRSFFENTEKFFDENKLRDQYKEAINDGNEKKPYQKVRATQISEHEKYMNAIQERLNERIEARTTKKKADFSQENPTKEMSSSEQEAIKNKENKDKEKVRNLLANKTRLYEAYLDKLEASIQLDFLEKNKPGLLLEEPVKDKKKENVDTTSLLLANKKDDSEDSGEDSVIDIYS
jgi:hypothetical protein